MTAKRSTKAPRRLGPARRLEPALRLALALCLALALGLACGKRERPPEDPTSLADFKIEGEIARALTESKRGRWGGADPVGADSCVYLAARLREDALRESTRADAADRLYARWRADPGNLLWMEKAIDFESVWRRGDALDAMLAHPLLADTTTARGHYARGYQSHRQPESLGDFLRAAGMSDSLPPLLASWTRMEAGKALVRRGRPPEGMQRLLAELPASRRLGGTAYESVLWREIARALRRMGRAPEALHAFQYAGELHAAAGLEREALLARLDLALLFSELGRTGATVTLLRELATDADALAWRHVALMARNRLANFYQSMAEVERALRLNQELATSIAAAGDSVTAPRAFLNVADSYTALGKLDSAWVAIAEARRWAAAHPNIDNDWAVHSQESGFWLLKGEFARADSLSRLAAETDAATRRPEEEVLRLFQLSRLGREIGRPEVSFRALSRLEALRDSIFVHMPGEDHAFDAALEAAHLRLETGEVDLASRLLVDAGERLALRHSPERAARLWNLRGELARATGGADRALAAFDSALFHAQASGMPERISRQRLALGQALLERGRVEDALAQLEHVGDHLAPDLSYRTRQERELMLGLAHAGRGEHEEAAAVFTEVLAGAKGTLARDLEVRLRLAHAKALDRLDQPVAALAQLDAAAALLSEGQLASGGSPLRFVAEDAVREAALGRIGLVRRHPELARDVDPARLTLDLRREMGRLAWGRSAAGLPATTTALTLALLLGEEESYLWLIDDGAVILHTLPGRGVIEEELHALRRSTLRPVRQVAAVSAERLAGWLLAPLAGRWGVGEPLQVLPDGALHGLPWAMLPWGDGMVLDHAPVVEVGDLDAGGMGRGLPRAAGRLLAIGFNGTAGGGRQPLEHAESEARAVTALWPGEAKLLVGESARGDLLEQLSASPFGVLHLSVHATVHQGLADRAYLGLATAAPDAPLLSAREIAGLPMRSELVFLSCCEASRGAMSRSGPILDLSRAFLQAGARAVIASSLRIDDRAAMELATRFYRHSLRTDDAAEALRRAQLELRNGEELAHPYYWAHYRLLRRSR